MGKTLSQNNLIRSNEVQRDLQRAIKPLRDDLSAMDLFVGLGLNVVVRNDITEFHTKSFVRDIAHPYFSLDFGPISDDPELLRKMKGGFSKWLIGSALRSLTEALIESVENLYRIIRHVETELNISRNGDFKTQDNKFERTTNIKSKLDQMKKNWSRSFMSSRTLSCLESITKARNCLAHSGEIVQEQHCTDKDQLIIRWEGFGSLNVENGTSIFGGLNGDETSADRESALEFTALLKDTGVNFMTKLPRSLAFKLGQKIDIPPEALTEMFFFFGSCSNEVVNAVVTLLLECGVEVTTDKLLCMLQHNPTNSADGPYITIAPI